MSEESRLEMSQDMAREPLIILLIGKTGNGRSTVGNMILGRKVFKTGRSMSSTTTDVQEAEGKRNGVDIMVVDTPDIINKYTDEKDMQMEVSGWKSKVSQRSFAVLLTVRCDVRYTAEEYAIYTTIKMMWGKELTDHLVVVFTFGDRQDRDIDEELRTVCKELKSVLNDAKGRKVVFNEKAGTEDQSRHVGQLMTLIHKMEQEWKGVVEEKEKEFKCPRTAVHKAFVACLLVLNAWCHRSTLIQCFVSFVKCIIICPYHLVSECCSPLIRWIVNRWPVMQLVSSLNGPVMQRVASLNGPHDHNI